MNFVLDRRVFSHDKEGKLVRNTDRERERERESRRVSVHRGKGEPGKRCRSIVPVVGGTRTQFASNYEETDTNILPLIHKPPL